MTSVEKKYTHHRSAVRHIRPDITASLFTSSMFGFTQGILIKLLDISSKGAAIECKENLNPKKNIVLELRFKENKKFTLNAQIVHQKSTHHHKKQYGVKFTDFNNELSDYLLESQLDLLFT